LNDHLFVACCCSACAVNQLAHEVDISPNAWIEFVDTDGSNSNGYSSLSSVLPPSHVTMERETTDIYQPPVSIEETAVIDKEESSIPISDEDNTDKKIENDEDVL
jgi:hypothetical protein